MHEHLEVFRDRDVVFYIDNEGGCSSLIRGSTSADDVARFVHLTHVKLMKINANLVILELLVSVYFPIYNIQ